MVLKVDTHRLYAMKTLRKADVLKRNQVAHVKAERDILAEADNEWVVKLYYSFQVSMMYLLTLYLPAMGLGVIHVVDSWSTARDLTSLPPPLSQDKDNLYFVMDYIPGGDLMSLLIKRGIFLEDLAR